MSRILCSKTPLLLALFFLFGSMFFLTDCSDEESIYDKLPANVEFTFLPTDLSRMLEFGPIGVIHVIPKDHGGFRLKEFSEDAYIPVYAMSDGIIHNIGKDTRTTDSGYEYDDYSLHIAVSKTAEMWYGHVSRLADEILAAAPNLNAGYGLSNKVNIEIKAGQIIGYIGPHPGFDIGMFDLAKEVYFANPGRYSQQYRHTQSWTDYLTPSLLEQVWRINPRTVPPLGGKISHDVAGTIAGNWFLDGTTDMTQWSKQLVFAYHEIYGDRIAIADASPLVDGAGILNDGREAYLWFVKGNTPQLSTINQGSGFTKYEVAKWTQLLEDASAPAEGTVGVQLVDEKTLKYEWFPGKSSSEVTGFSAAVKIYKR